MTGGSGFGEDEREILCKFQEAASVEWVSGHRQHLKAELTSFSPDLRRSKGTAAFSDEGMSKQNTCHRHR